MTGRIVEPAAAPIGQHEKGSGRHDLRDARDPEGHAGVQSVTVVWWVVAAAVQPSGERGFDQQPDLDWDVRRFRPNLVIDTDGPPFVENDWSGQRLRIGAEATLAVMGPTVRCAMPLRAQPGLERQAELLRAMSDLNIRFLNHLGASATVHRPGRVAAGDPVALLGPD